MARSSKRAGFGNQRGSINPKMTVSEVAPKLPKKNDVWLDISGTATWKYYDGSAWQSV